LSILGKVAQEGLRMFNKKRKKNNKKNKRNITIQAMKKALITFAIKAGISLVSTIFIFGCIGSILDLFGGGDSSGSTAYAADEFVSIENNNLLIEYIHSWEGEPPKNTDGTKYIIHDDGAGHPTVGWGVDIKNCGFYNDFIDAGYSTSIGDEIDIEFVDNIEKKEMENKSNYVKNKTAELNLEEYQVHALVSRAYNAGNYGAIDKKRGSLNLNFVDSYKKYWNKGTDDKFGSESADFENELYKEYLSAPVTSDGEYLEGLENRRKSEFTLFQTGYYDEINKKYTKVTNNASTIVEWAEVIHSYMEQNSYKYCVYKSNNYEEHKNSKDCGLNRTFVASKTGYRTSCCATFVSWVLQEAGYITEADHSDGAITLRGILENKGWTRINNKNDLVAGDILCFNGHIEIYAGDGKSYNAGSGEAIRNSAPAYGVTIGGSSYLYGLRAPKNI